MKYFILFFLLLFSRVSYSCSCSPSGKIDEIQFNKYDLIIKGKIIKPEEKNLIRFIHIEVDTFFKGKLNPTIIKVETPSQSSRYGISPKIGEQWLVFAYKKENSYNTSLCTRTKNLNPKAWDFRKDEIEDDIKYLNTKIGTKNHG